MPILTDLGLVVSYQEVMKQQKALKMLGIRQFLHKLRRFSGWNKPSELTSIKWGQEMEGHFLRFNSEGELELCKGSISGQYKNLPFQVVMQYGSWMFETTPKRPYTTICNFGELILGLRQKFQVMHQQPKMALMMPVIPFLGVCDLKKQKKFTNIITQSLYLDDDHITDYIRFKTLAENIRLRRGGKNVESYAPIYRDINTDLQQLSKTQPREGYIHMDAMAFGNGFCSLQCTFSTKNLNHARYVYDQFNVLSPIFLAMTAGSPVFKGKLSNWDVRWNVISACVDDRNQSERDPTSPYYIASLRHGVVNYYISNNPLNKPQYSDFKTGVRQSDIQFVKRVAEQSNTQLDQKLRFHLANYVRRDYLLVYENSLSLTQQDIIVFQLLHGCHWQSVKLKAPTDQDMGWLVEFRTMEIQLTADLNAAFSMLIHLIARVLHENSEINLYIPITLLRENFQRAHQKNAVLSQRFYFRTNIHGQGDPIVAQLTIEQIMFGKGDFKGIFYEVERTMKSCLHSCGKFNGLLGQLKNFFVQLVTGKRKTLATWMREYINKHSQYTHNSILNKKLMDELVITLWKIQNGQILDNNFRQIFSIQSLQIANKYSKIQQNQT